VTRNQSYFYDSLDRLVLAAENPSVVRLPKAVLTASEAEQVMQQTRIHDPLGLRNRAILETLYSTGMRRLELVNLTLWDLDLERATFAIRQGKAKKDRIIPLGDRTALWVRKYLDESRP